MTSDHDHDHELEVSPAVEDPAPVGFSFRNRFDQHALYTLDPSQTMQLDVFNLARGTITIPAAPECNATTPEEKQAWLEEYHHFYLTFRPGTLWAPGDQTDGIELVNGSPWHLEYDRRRNDHLQGFFLWSSEELVWKNGSPLELQLDNVRVDGRGGSRGTRVELRFQNLTLAGRADRQGNPVPLMGTRTHFLNVLDQNPTDQTRRKAIEVRIEDPGTVLNNGQQQTIYMVAVNRSGGPLALDEDSAIQLHFPAVTQTNQWGLVQGENAFDGDTKSSVQIETVRQFRPVKNDSGTVTTYTAQGTWTSVPPTTLSADHLVWTLKPEHVDGPLEADGKIRIPITLSTTVGSGLCYIPFYFGNIGVERGTIDVPITKSPLTVNQQRVGLGTDVPEAPFHVLGIGDTLILGPINGSNLRLGYAGDYSYVQSHGNKPLAINPVGNNVGIGTKDPKAKLHVFSSATQDTKIDPDADLIVQQFENAFVQINSWWQRDAGILFGRPSSSRHGAIIYNDTVVGSGLRFVSGDSIRMIVRDHSGYVGIGTTDPQAPLNVHGEGDTLILGPTSQSNLRLGYTKTHSYVQSHGSKPLVINPLGNNVGIRTTNPGFPLHVTGFGNDKEGGRYFTARNGRGDGYHNNTNDYVSIKAEWYVEAFGFIATSDQRIKDEVQPSDQAHDLKAIQKLQVRNYRLKDHLQCGESSQKGFIAQEVTAVIPEAVKTGCGCVPDIYLPAAQLSHDESQHTLLLTLDTPHGLLTGEIVRLYLDGVSQEIAVSAVPTPHSFLVSPIIDAPEEVFVYGRRVDDLLSLDYNRIFTTGIAAIQQLKAEKDAEVQQLKSENAALYSHLAELEQRLSRLEAHN